eukprot:gb/GECH01006172.1/.p1 GENE.gb/GECH01006172.1/~~gb/GECH01006172.1/.p1  ORF type:complete len:360 (+),score=95.98 gb/GECH01006172.1/:1-1080(+)
MLRTSSISKSRASSRPTSSPLFLGRQRNFSSKDKKHIGFIGLGQMGSRMAPHLASGSSPDGTPHHLHVFDLSSDAMRQAESVGASTHSSAKDVAANTDMLFTMLPNAADVKRLYRDEKEGIFAGVRPDSLLVDCSTIDVETTRELAQEARDRYQTWMLDAPVSGGIGGAAAGTLTFMVGGDEGQFSRAEPLLRLMGKNVVHCGPPGNGLAAKICNNLVLGVSMVAMSEAMLLGKMLGLDPKVLSDTINTSSGRCWSNDTYNPYPGVLDKAPSSNGYRPGFANPLMRKDLGLAVDAARAAGLELEMGPATEALYSRMVEEGMGQLDFSSALPYILRKHPHNNVSMHNDHVDIHDPPVKEE